MSKASPAIIYEFLTSPACLVRWFCDAVEINEDVFTFFWGGNEEVAHVVDRNEEAQLRLKWEEAPLDEYLEFVMYQSPITAETIIEVTDFADEGDEQSIRDEWSHHIDSLKREAGG